MLLSFATGLMVFYIFMSKYTYVYTHIHMNVPTYTFGTRMLLSFVTGLMVFGWDCNRYGPETAA